MASSTSAMMAGLNRPAGSAGLLGRVRQRGQIPQCPGRKHTPSRPRALPAVASVGPVASGSPVQDIYSLASLTAPDSASTLAYTLAEMSPETAATVAALLGPFLSVGTLLFILRIVTTWYSETDGSKFPWVLVYFPTEWILAPSRKVIPPQFGVDVSPIVWVAILSFLNEILLGPQGILNLIQRQQLSM